MTDAAGKVRTYWYPPEWRCVHGVNLNSIRCIQCDALIDWKGVRVIQGEARSEMTVPNPSDAATIAALEARCRELEQLVADLYGSSEDEINIEVYEAAYKIAVAVKARAALIREPKP